MNEQLVADALGFDDKAFGAIRTQTDDFSDNSIARDFDRREVAFGIEAAGKVLSDGIARVERVTARAAPIANAPFRKFRRLIWIIAADYTTRRVNRE